MAVEIELFGRLLPGTPRKRMMTLEAPVTVGEVLFQLRLDPEEVGLISINGVQSELEDLVPQECRLCFFPPLSGG